MWFCVDSVKQSKVNLHKLDADLSVISHNLGHLSSQALTGIHVVGVELNQSRNSHLLFFSFFRTLLELTISKDKEPPHY